MADQATVLPALYGLVNPEVRLTRLESALLSRLQTTTMRFSIIRPVFRTRRIFNSTF